MQRAFYTMGEVTIIYLDLSHASYQIFFDESGVGTNCKARTKKGSKMQEGYIAKCLWLKF